MFQVVPSIDLRNEKVVRLQQGDYDRQLNYDLDPIETARSFEADGAQWMHIVDLDGAKQGAVAQAELIGKIIAATKLKVQVGGGVRSEADIRQLLDAGAARVVVGTKAIEEWDWFKKLIHSGAYDGRIVLAIDAKDGKVATRGWTQTTQRLAIDIAREVSDWKLGALLYTDVAKDGMLQGPNVEQTSVLAHAARVPVIASGGVGSLGHMSGLMTHPIWGVIIGRSLHDGKITLREAIHLTKSGNP